MMHSKKFSGLVTVWLSAAYGDPAEFLGDAFSVGSICVRRMQNVISVLAAPAASASKASDAASASASRSRYLSVKSRRVGVVQYSVRVGIK
jgi:hypothetical protein